MHNGWNRCDILSFAELLNGSSQATLDKTKWETTPGVKMPSRWLTHTSRALPVLIHWVSCFSGGWGKVSLAFSALIIRWHFTQHSVWIKALLSALLQLHICFPPSPFLCRPLSSSLSITASLCNLLSSTRAVSYPFLCGCYWLDEPSNEKYGTWKLALCTSIALLQEKKKRPHLWMALFFFTCDSKWV